MDNLYVVQNFDLDGYKIHHRLTFGEIHDQFE